MFSENQWELGATIHTQITKLSFPPLLYLIKKKWSKLLFGEIQCSQSSFEYLNTLLCPQIYSCTKDTKAFQNDF